MAQSAYDLYKKTYNKKMSAVNAQDALQTQEKADREAQAQKNLEASNRGVYTTYKQAINPFGVTAAQNNLPSGVSDYMKNAAYGTMLQGLGSNQNNFQEAMNNSNSLWYSWLADKAGMESDALSEYNNAVVAQQNYDKEQEEDKRRYDQEFELQKQSLRGSGGSGNGSGGYGSSLGNLNVENEERKLYGNVNGNMWSPTKDIRSDNTVVRTEIKMKNGIPFRYGYNANNQIVSVIQAGTKQTRDNYHRFSANSNQ